MRKINKFLKILFTYTTNLFIYNREGWYIGDVPNPDSQGFRIMTKQKPYHERTCKMCKRSFWSYKKVDVCFRIECYFKYHLQEV
jgi:hypothetical protein